MSITPDNDETRSADAPTGDSVFDSLKDKSLKAAGYSYLVGDAGLFASGFMAGRYKEASSGLLWGLGGLVCAKYANPGAEKQLKLLSSRLSHYLHKEGVEIPKNPDTDTLNRQDGVIDRIESFLHQYPSQILNATYAVGGGLLLRSGLQHAKPWDTASGALVTAGALAGLLVQEKKPDPDHPPQGAIGKTLAWLQEKPLRISGGLYALNNVTLVMSALNEYKTNPAQKSYVFKFLTAASYMFGNTMLAMSSKSGHGNSADADAALDKLATASAQVVAAQPPEVRDALVQHIAAFLSAQPEVHMKADDIAAMLNQKMMSLPTPERTGEWQDRVSTLIRPQTSPSV